METREDGRGSSLSLTILDGLSGTREQSVSPDVLLSLDGGTRLRGSRCSLVSDPDWGPGAAVRQVGSGFGTDETPHLFCRSQSPSVFVSPSVHVSEFSGSEVLFLPDVLQGVVPKRPNEPLHVRQEEDPCPVLGEGRRTVDHRRGLY